jgi:hypothetical protein
MTYKYGNAFSSDELQYFEEASFRNMVTFYREELHQLIQGGMAKSIFTKGDRRVLRRLGILQLKGTGKSGRRLVITSKARNLL